MSNREIPLVSGKLSKTFLLGLPEGAYVVSNSYHGPGKPAYAGYVAKAQYREKQWRQIKNCFCTERPCMVFRTKAEFLGWLKSLRTG